MEKRGTSTCAASVRAAAFVPLTLALVLGAPGALAQSRLPSLDLERVRLNPGAEHSLVIATGVVRPEGASRVTLAGHYTYGTSVTRVGDDFGNARLGHRTQGLLAVSHTFSDRLQLGLEIPVVFHQEETDSLTRLGLASVAKNGLGNPRVSARVAILRRSDGQPVNLAVAGAVGLPMGRPEALARDPQPTVLGDVSFGREVMAGSAHTLDVGGYLGVRMRSQEDFAYRGLSPNEADTVDHELLLAAHASRAFHPKVRAELGVVADVSLKNPGVTLQPFLAGRYEIEEGMEAFLGGGPAFGSLAGTPMWRLLAGLSLGGGE